MRSARLVHEKVVEFKSDRLSLAIPVYGSDGWTIVPLTRLVVSVFSIPWHIVSACVCVCVFSVHESRTFTTMCRSDVRTGNERAGG